MEKFLRNNWIKAIIINVIIAAAIIVSSHMVYETNDDYAISSRIAAGYAAVYYVNYYFCILLTKIQAMFPEINCFVLAQLVSSFVSWVSITKILADKSKRISSTIVCIAVIAVLSFDSYCRIQFSKTAAIAAIAGILVVIDSFTNKRNAGYYVLGLVLFCIGVSFRRDALLVAVAFGGLCVLEMLVDKKTEAKASSAARKTAAIMLMLVVVAGGYLLKTASDRVLESDKELNQYVEYNDLRSEVVDMPTLNGFENRMEEYEAVGLSHNDINLIRSWIFDYEGAASKENFEAIVKIGDGKTVKERALGAVRSFIKGTKEDINNLNTMGIRIIIMLVLAIWLLATSSKNSRLFIVAVGALTIIMHIYLYYIGRAVNRTTYVSDICAITTMLYIAIESIRLEKLRSAFAVVIVVIMAFLIVPTRENSSQLYQKAEGNIMAKEFTEYIHDHQESFFVVSTREKGSNIKTLSPLKTPDIQGEKNILGAGSWGTMSPYLFDKTEKYGIRNPVKDLIDKENAYYVGNNNIDQLTEHYNKWHGNEGKQVYLEEYEEIAGKKIWKVRTRSIMN